LILIRVKSFSLALAFLIQSSTSVVLSGSGGRIRNGSLLAAANERKIYNKLSKSFFIIPYHSIHQQLMVNLYLLMQHDIALD